MKSTVVAASVVAAAVGAAAQQYSPFSIVYLDSHQPNGVADGQVNYYNIQVNVTSTNGDTPQSAWCWTLWGDNLNPVFCTGDDCAVPWSTNVPTGEWITCAHNSSNLGDQTSNFAFQLFPYFSVGNFSIQFQQNFTSSGSQVIAQSEVHHITNTTGLLSCDITPYESSGVNQHASGDCYLAANVSSIEVPVASGAAACQHAKTVSVGFPVTETTAWGDTVVVVGNITQLGGWNLRRSRKLNADQYTSANSLWNGSVSIPAGTAFEYKYAQRYADGHWLWECGENRVFTVSDYTCGYENAGNDPDYFRCGDH